VTRPEPNGASDTAHDVDSTDAHCDLTGHEVPCSPSAPTPPPVPAPNDRHARRATLPIVRVQEPRRQRVGRRAADPQHLRRLLHPLDIVEPPTNGRRRDRTVKTSGYQRDGRVPSLRTPGRRRTYEMTETYDEEREPRWRRR
jgi:hypothetical protein